MSDFKCPMCLDCPDNCPLDNEEDTREYSADYYKGRADGIEECVGILKESYPIIDNEDILYGFSCAIHRMEQLKEQMQKGEENESSD